MADASSTSGYAALYQQVPLLSGKTDPYGGFIVDPNNLPSDANIFSISLRKSLEYWISQGLKGIWLELPLQNSNLVHPATQAGFKYHHAEETHVTLTQWLPQSPSTLPANASHIVGVGAVVMKDNEILAVQESTGPTQGSGVWKMPTGVVRMGADIKSEVERYVFEETQVKADFVEILGIRQSHGAAFGKSDLFVVCLLRPTDSTSELQPMEGRIKLVRWMPLEEFKSQPFNSKSEVLTRVADMAAAAQIGEYHGFGADFLNFGFRKKGSYFYHNVGEIKKFLATNNME